MSLGGPALFTEFIIFLIIPAVIVGFLLFFLFVAMWEKQSVREFSPTDEPPQQEQSKYTQATNRDAESHGFLPGGWYEKRSRRLYRATATIWVSPDRLTLVLVGGGRIGGMAFKKTYLYSRLRNDRIILSVDNAGESDLSGAMERRYLLNADFGELYDFHLDRLERADADPIPFNDADPIHGVEKIERLRADLIVQRGWGRFTDADRTEWRYTFIGALVNLRRTFFGGQLAEGLKQIKRIDKPQAGD